MRYREYDGSDDEAPLSSEKMVTVTMIMETRRKWEDGISGSMVLSVPVLHIGW